MTDRAAARWEGLSGDALAARWGVPAVHAFAQAGSTNDVARALAEAGAPAGTCVVAEAQTAGRGRGGKAWASPAGVGIFLSMVLRPARLGSPGLLPILGGLAAAEALDGFVKPQRVQVKWPNDLWLAGRKLAGILCEGAWEEGRAPVVIAGIGVNVLHQPDDFPPEVRETATSLRIASGWSPPREEVAGAVVRAVLRLAGEPPSELPGALQASLHARDALAGRPVQVTGATEVTGTALGVTPAGALLVRDGAGVLRTVTSGTVRPLATG